MLVVKCRFRTASGTSGKLGTVGDLGAERVLQARVLDENVASADEHQHERVVADCFAAPPDFLMSAATKRGPGDAARGTYVWRTRVAAWT
jgi:hypothetical protein